MANATAGFEVEGVLEMAREAGHRERAACPSSYTLGLAELAELSQSIRGAHSFQ